MMAFNLTAGIVMSWKPGKDFRHSFEKPPVGTWYTALVLVHIQAYVHVS